VGDLDDRDAVDGHVELAISSAAGPQLAAPAGGMQYACPVQ
jgi:hypothetical protein